MSDTRNWWPEGYGDDPAFQLRREVYGFVTGGDYARGSQVLTLPHTALRYPTEPGNLTEIQDRAILLVRPSDHTTVEIQWGWPPMFEGRLTGDPWLEVALVRSTFGRPSTPNDGQTVFRAFRMAFEGEDAIGPAPIVFDRPLTPGYWYYYGLFFRIDQVNWIRGMVNSCLLPRDLGHTGHLWNGVPPYYQWTDNNISVDGGPLRRFLSVFGFELDQTREFIESWQHVYDVDRAPSKLLRRVGENLGLPFEQGMGEIRFRSLLARIGELFERRGTAPCLLQMVEQFTKYECDISAGTNLLLQPDDSDFYMSTGNWAGLHYETLDPIGTVLHPSLVTLEHNSLEDMTPPEGFGRGSMRVYTSKADELADFSITLGDGVFYSGGVSRPIIPLEAGIPVHYGNSYGFSVVIQPMQLPIMITIGIMWFDQNGLPTSLVDTLLGVSEVINTAGWHQFIIEGSVPSADVIYGVPYINFQDRTAGPAGANSPYIHVAGVSVWQLAFDLGGVTVAPNRFLTVGDAGEKLGVAKEGFDPYVLGDR
jgi:phage tail-like protein